MENKNKKQNKTFLGMPMQWERNKLFKNLWNSTDDRIFPQKTFGIGWGINFYSIAKRLGLVRKS